MLPFLLGLHSGVRWLVVLVTIVALGKMALGMIQKQSYDQFATRIMLAFKMLLRVQALLGILVLLALGVFNSGTIWSHAGVMVVAVGAAEMGARWKNAPDATRYRNNLLLIIGILVLVFIGVSIVGGWKFGS